MADSTGRCGACGYLIRLRKDGTIGAHQLWQGRQFRYVCAGTGGKPVGLASQASPQGGRTQLRRNPARTHVKPGQSADEIRRLLTLLHELPNCEVGGPLHIVTDDVNVLDTDLNWCQEHMDESLVFKGLTEDAANEIRSTCNALLRLLRTLTVDQRERVIERWWLGVPR